MPYLSVNLGLALTIASLAVLIYFIHHLSQSIQSEQLLAGIGKDFEGILPQLYSESHRQVPFQSDQQWLKAERWQSAWGVWAKSDGYLQHVDEASLIKLAAEQQLILKLAYRPGDFIAEGTRLLWGLPGKEPESGLLESLNACFVLGRQRTPQQDAAYYLHQLVEIAQRALSPGINEPYTALSSIDWLGSSLLRVARYPRPSAFRWNQSGQLCLIVPILGFAELVKTSLGPLRLVAVSNPDVVVHLLQTISQIASALKHDADREALWQQAELLAKMAKESLSFGPDCERIALALASVQADLKRIDSEMT